jgi:hypothetical protein
MESVAAPYDRAHQSGGFQVGLALNGRKVAGIILKVNMAIRRWWNSRSEETYWLEITDRPDVGADLKAPQTKDDGREFWGYSLIKEVEAGDVIFHFDLRREAIVSLVARSGWLLGR